MALSCEEETYGNSNETTKTRMDSFLSSSCFPLTLQFIDITYRIKLDTSSASKSLRLRRIFYSSESYPATEERTILNGINGMVSPGEMLAILGPSGSGKSTLLNILSGRLQGRHYGSVLANGQRLNNAILRRTGFVTQDDILYPHLTVRETLVFCAMLRLPKTVEKSEKVSAAETVMSELGLCRCADTMVGSAFIRGVSGGERKRVSIAHEMLVNPSLLVLDEPTSGLDSTAASRLVCTLSGLARKGKTVIMSVHQPASRVYQMFDSVLLLSEGNCIYFGKATDAMDYFASLGFAPKFYMNPADFMLDLANGISQTEYQGDDQEKLKVKQSLVSAYNRLLEPSVKASITATVRGDAQTCKEKPTGRQKKDCSRISWFSEFNILLRRSLKERKYETFNFLRVFQVLAAALLAGSMWWHSNIHDVRDRLGLLFYIAIFWGVFASFNAVFTFPQERAIFIKERASGMYSLSSYFMARMAGDLPMELILPTLFITILYWMAGLRPELSAFCITLAVLLSYVLVAQGFGLALGAAIMNAKQASTIVTITMLAFLLTGGFYVHNVPSCMGWMKYISFTYYCYGLLISTQYTEDEITSLMGYGNQNQAELARELEEQVSSANTIIGIAALIAMFIGYRALACIFLRRIRV